MESILLATKRQWNWKVFLVLVGLIVPAVLAIMPFDISRQNAPTGTDLIASLGWETIVLDRLINTLLIAMLAAIGLVLANRIGLGMPFVEGRVKRAPVPHRFRSIVAMAWITAIALVLSSLLLRTMVFDPPLNAMLAQLGITIPEDSPASPPYGFLASMSAGIKEETLFRLFGLSLLAWLGGLLFHDPDGRPKPLVFWTANVVLALAFGAAHLPTAASLGLPVNALVVISTLVLNGIGGLVFGGLFWTFGLESAMLAHFLADVIKITLIPLITIQDADLARYAVAACALVAVILTFIWACRSLIAERRRHHPQMMPQRAS